MCGSITFSFVILTHPHGRVLSSVAGGFVYRGVKYADLLYGNYVFAEYQQQ